MRSRTLPAGILLLLAVACSCSGGDRPLVREQRLPSGRLVKVVSCLLAWGIEHDERHPGQDSFALEYLSSIPRDPRPDLEREVVEVFELIRPISEQWGLSTAGVTALRTPDRRGTYDVFTFTRSASGAWSHSSFAITR